MKYKEFIEIRNNSHTKERQAIYENLKKVLDLPEDDAVSAPAESRSVSAEKAASKRRTSFKNFFKKPARLIACISTAVAVACLAVILPFTLNQSGVRPAVPPTASDDRFCVAAACQQVELDYTLKEYSVRNNLSILYVDWYDVAEIKTSLYVNNEDQTDIIYYQEILEHKYTGSIVELYITDPFTRVDKIFNIWKGCKNVYTVYTSKTKYTQVMWYSDRVFPWGPYECRACFRYDKYNYTVVLRYPMGENDIFELIESMLPKTRK